jgi:osmotically-inducible protein OsmY
LQATLEDARNRAAGTLAEAQQRFRAEPIDDAQLVERVRARIGLVCAEPTKVEVTAANGCVTLRGTVPRVEIAPIVHSAKWTRGVRMVDEQLTTDDAETGS